MLPHNFCEQQLQLPEQSSGASWRERCTKRYAPRISVEFQQLEKWSFRKECPSEHFFMTAEWDCEYFKTKKKTTDHFHCCSVFERTSSFFHWREGGESQCPVGTRCEWSQRVERKQRSPMGWVSLEIVQELMSAGASPVSAFARLFPPSISQKFTLLCEAETSFSVKVVYYGRQIGEKQIVLQTRN